MFCMNPKYNYYLNSSFSGNTNSGFKMPVTWSDSLMTALRTRVTCVTAEHWKSFFSQYCTENQIT